MNGINRNVETHASKDEVDFVVVANNNNNNNNNNYESNKISNGNLCKTSANMKKNSSTTTTTIVTTNTNATAGEHKKSSSNKERLSLFSFGKKIAQKTQTNVGSNNNKSNNNNSNSNSNGNSNNSNNSKETTMVEPEKYTPVTLQCQPPPIPIGTPPRQQKFVKSTSPLSRFLSSTYNAKKFEKEEQKRRNNANGDGGKFNTFGGRRRLSGPYLERFKHYSKEEGDAASTTDNTLCIGHSECGLGNGTTSTAVLKTKKQGTGEMNSPTDTLSVEHFRDGPHGGAGDLGAKAMRTLSRGLGKLWWKRTHSVDISLPDPEYKVSYLGNVLTGWAKGEGCVEKQLNTLWRNYTQNSKPDVIMRVKVCASGLKATTRQHGLTEYWANRITHCCAPKNFPRVFCWVYRHEGRKLKHELRCHAVLCNKEKVAQDICNTLKENLESALREFKREKILKQNARLSLANAAYDNPSLPRRKILLSVGGNNYRPPLERSKSAPKLMAIEEAIGEEDGEEVEETNEPEMKPCCQKDSLYPAMTLGRRRCRRGHSIRRTGKARPYHSSVSFEQPKHDEKHCCSHKLANRDNDTKEVAAKAAMEEEENRHSYGSDDSDDFDKLLKHNNYDTNASLSNELLPYFERQLHMNNGSNSLGDLSELKDDEDEPLSLLPTTINSDPSADPEGDYTPVETVGLRRNGVCSDGEEEADYSDADDMYFRQLNMLHRNSMRKMKHISSLSSDEPSSIETTSFPAADTQYHHQPQSSISSDTSSTGISTSAQQSNGVPRQPLSPDSDEGSISSGCETASTATANQDDLSLSYRHSGGSNATYGQQYSTSGSELCVPEQSSPEEPITAEEIYQRLEARLQGRHNSDATTFSSSSSITLKMGTSPSASVNGLDDSSPGSANTVTRTRRTRRQRDAPARNDDTDSECSDESGYVEFQEREKCAKTKLDTQQQQQLPTQQPAQSISKPQPPPKPLPRRLLSTGNINTTTSV